MVVADSIGRMVHSMRDIGFTICLKVVDDWFIMMATYMRVIS